MKSLNEEVLNIVEEMLSENLNEDYELSIVTSDNKDKVLKKSKKLQAIKKVVRDFVDNPSKLDDIGATQLYVLDATKEDDNEVFIFTNDNGNWVVDYDLLNDYGYDDEYKNTLLNKVYYSLTGSLPDNFAKNAHPELKASLIRPSKSSEFVRDADESGYYFADNGDCIIKVSLDVTEQDPREKTKQWVQTVAQNFDVTLEESGKDTYKIIIPDQEKYYVD